MGNIAIQATKLGKRYRLGRSAVTQNFRERLTHLMGAPFRAARSALRRPANERAQGRPDHIWALRDVSFTIGQGEVIGVIGRNGAGKSTLLKVLTRITEPTEGEAIVRGRVGSLLEVGTGFHPELTGRENIYLNGAILGMKRAETARKFDEIVAFSEVEKFIDTPVKRYSSGMYLRLAFAVAAHLQTEVLLVDEVLAVGDAEFQRKCLGKLGDVAKAGRTVLFVSHNLSAIQRFCSRVLLVADGQLAMDGATSAVVDAYLSMTSRSEYGFADVTEHPGRTPGMPSIIQAVGLCDPDQPGQYRTTVRTGEDLVFEIHYDCGERFADWAQLAVCSLTEHRVFTSGSTHKAGSDLAIRGCGMLQCRLPAVPLTAGEYTVTVMLSRRVPPRNLDYVTGALRFHVDFANYFGSGTGPYPGQGHLAQPSQWQILQGAPI